MTRKSYKFRDALDIITIKDKLGLDYFDYEQR